MSKRAVVIIAVALSFILVLGPAVPTLARTQAGNPQAGKKPVQQPARTAPVADSKSTKRVKDSKSTAPAADAVRPSRTPSTVKALPHGAGNIGGNWATKNVKSSWQAMPPLKAQAGVTALAGQVLTLDGKPLANVTLQVADKTTRTDGSGRFLLSYLPTGYQVMKLDGRSANSPQATYGIFKIRVNLAAGKTGVLPYTIWMPKLDTEHAVAISGPTKKEIIVTNPNLPGLELRLPPGTFIRDMAGKPVSEISITPIPTSQPPFPLPAGVNVPLFFTIQAGGAQVIPPRGKLIYPNLTRKGPGTRIDFWNYDATEKGWYVYGKGTVSANGKQIIPDPAVVVYEFSGAMVANPNMAPGDGPPPCADCEDGDPVDLATGLFVYRKTDLVLSDIIPASLMRTFRDRDSYTDSGYGSRPFGHGTTDPYDIFLIGDAYPSTYIELILPDGARVHYDRTSSGTQFYDGVYETGTVPGVYYKSKITYGADGWELRFKNGTVYSFPAPTFAQVQQQAALTKIRDRNGNVLRLVRSADDYKLLKKIITPNGRWIELAYDGSNRITQARDNIGRVVSYEYDSGGHLWKVTGTNGGVTEYTYDSSHRMLTIKDARGIVFLTNEYDSEGNVFRQTQADSSTFEFTYTRDVNGKIVQTDVVDPRGITRRVTFNASGYLLTDTYALGETEEQTVTFERQTGSNLVTAMIDPLGRRTNYSHDTAGNVTSVTDLAGTSSAVTTNFTYESTFGRITSISDPLSHTSSFAYDSNGNLTSVTDPLDHETSLTYNAAGQPLTVTDPLSHTTNFAYSSGTLSEITDPLGRIFKRYTDGAGRPVLMTNALGNNARIEYNAANHPTRLINSLNGVTAFTYDLNGNLASVTDPRGGVTAYTYDSMDRLASRTDPLENVETFEYDAAGNPKKTVDRRGKMTTATYDKLNRLTFIGYGTTGYPSSPSYESSKSFTYDDASRLTEVSDSISGSITLAYDSRSNLTSETSPQGVISYEYDAADRKTSMTVTGQLAVTYTYDNSNRLTEITQGSSSVNLAYDAASRRTSLTMPNGISTDYSYDNGSQLTGLSYKLGETVLGDLNYEYDSAGRRVKAGGSFARTLLPTAITSFTHGAANQLTQRGSATLTYDENGNLTSDGTNSYSWNERNQLASMSGPGLSASFQYDAFGRRVSKTVNSTTVGFLYDGSDAVQELVDDSPVTNMVVGGVDEVFTRADSESVHTLVGDGLGSTTAIFDATGDAETEYSYEPFGKTAATGSTSNNPGQFTGRENDGTGLYYYRARYYSPTLQRFISQDPIGFGGGDPNLYAYVQNSPLNYTDSSGQILDTLLDIGFIAYDIYRLATDGRKDLGGNLLALGADVAGALIPFATGLGAASRVARTGREVVVIGENMARVEKYANKIGAETFQGLTKEENRLWVEEVKKAGKEVVDIGPDFERRAKRAEQGLDPYSPGYNMERTETKGYQGYRKAFQRTGKCKGGAPGVDF